MVDGVRTGISEAKIEGAVIAVKKFNITPQLAAQEYSVSLDELLEKL